METNSNFSIAEFEFSMLMENSTGIISPPKDFWACLFEWGYLQWITVIWSSITILFTPPLLYNIIKFNSNKHYKTIIHDFESAIGYYAQAYYLTAHLGSLIRMIFGPMPQSYCWWWIFSKNSFNIAIQLSLDFNITARYIYLIILKKHAALHEEFWSFYLNFWIFIYSMISGYLYMVIPGKFGTNYYICQGLDPKIDEYDVDKFPIGMIGAANIIWYLYLSIKVYRYKIKKLNEPIFVSCVSDLVEQNNQTYDEDAKIKWKKFKIGDKPKSSASIGYLPIMVFLFIICIEQTSWHYLVKKMSPDDIMKSAASHIAIYSHDQLLANALFWVLITVIYQKNPSLWNGLNPFRNHKLDDKNNCQDPSLLNAIIKSTRITTKISRITTTENPQPSGTGTISENSNDQNGNDEMEENQIGSQNGKSDVIVEVHKIEDININDDISHDKDAWWKHSAPGPSQKKTAKRVHFKK